MANNEHPDWLVEGTELVERTGARGADFGRVCKIRKVYKTGKFVTDMQYPMGGNDMTQYRPVQDGQAVSVGGSGWSQRLLTVITDKVRAEMAEYKQFTDACKVINDEAERLRRFERSFVNREQIIAEAKRIGRKITVYDWEISSTNPGDPSYYYARTPERAEAARKTPGVKVTTVYTIEE